MPLIGHHHLHCHHLYHHYDPGSNSGWLASLSCCKRGWRLICAWRVRMSWLGKGEGCSVQGNSTECRGVAVGWERSSRRIQALIMPTLSLQCYMVWTYSEDKKPHKSNVLVILRIPSSLYWIQALCPGRLLSTTYSTGNPLSFAFWVIRWKAKAGDQRVRGEKSHYIYSSSPSRVTMVC